MILDWESDISHYYFAFSKHIALKFVKTIAVRKNNSTFSDLIKVFINT